MPVDAIRRIKLGPHGMNTVRFPTSSNADHCNSSFFSHSRFQLPDGVRTLEDKEVTDAPLLKLARIKSDVLTYVHLVKATEVSPVKLSTQEDPISEEEESWDCFDEDSDEEAEFEE